MNQLNIFQVHQCENNLPSQLHLNENRDGFSAQCQKVYQLLFNGTGLTVLSAMNEYQIMSLPRRILDIKESGFKISSRWENKIKLYYMSEEDRGFNRERERGHS